MSGTQPTGTQLASQGIDPWAIDGKFPAPEEQARLLVVGAGPAGLAAATEAARLGLSVVLIDENPVPAGLMGLDVPLFYGQRMNAGVQEQARMVERLVAATPAIEAAFDAGVDVRLGVTAWGAFAAGPALNALPGRVAGLTDGARTWLCGFDALILATGARDLVLGFEGADLPGVMGAQGLHSLLTRYDAFTGKRLVILGSGDLAARTALCALDRGLDVAALIETLPQPQAASGLLAELAARGVQIRTGCTLLRAEGDGTGVTAAILARNGVLERVGCDTICLAVGAVPTIELAGVLGCALSFRGDLGGYVPLTGAAGASSLPGVFCAGDCAGLLGGPDPQAEAAAQGRAAAQAADAWLSGGAALPALSAAEPRPDQMGYRLNWMRALLREGGLQAPVCLCEEVSREELLGVRPPRYLGCDSARMAARDGKSLAEDGPLHPDQIKRLTRAGMGACQGRRCREQIALLLAIESGTLPGEIPLASYRAPVRPLPLGLLGSIAEPQAMRQHWDVWFGIRTQWIPYDKIGTAEEAALLAAGAGGNMHA
jgi:thioredoxin reductase